MVECPFCEQELPGHIVDQREGVLSVDDMIDMALEEGGSVEEKRWTDDGNPACGHSTNSGWCSREVDSHEDECWQHE